MDQGAGPGLAGLDSHLERVDGKAGLQMIGHRPADDAAARLSPGRKLSSTMLAFSDDAQRRRRSGPEETVTVAIWVR